MLRGEKLKNLKVNHHEISSGGWDVVGDREVLQLAWVTK